MKVSSIVQTRRPVSHLDRGPVAVLALVVALAALVWQKTSTVAQAAAVPTTGAGNAARAAVDPSVVPTALLCTSLVDDKALPLDFWTF